MERLIREGKINVNYAEPLTGKTALHAAAAECKFKTIFFEQNQVINFIHLPFFLKLTYLLWSL